MQRLITLDSVIYVHENPRRRRLERSHAPEETAELAAAPESGLSPSYAEPSEGWSPVESDAGLAEVAAAVAAELAASEAEAERDAAAAEPRSVTGPESWLGGQPVATAARSAPEPVHVSEPEPVARFHTQKVVRSTPLAPPPGYAVEFGTGRLVPLHSYRGRMSYPSGR